MKLFIQYLLYIHELSILTYHMRCHENTLFKLVFHGWVDGLN